MHHQEMCNVYLMYSFDEKEEDPYFNDGLCLNNNASLTADQFSHIPASDWDLLSRRPDLEALGANSNGPFGMFIFRVLIEISSFRCNRTIPIDTN